MIKPLSHNEQMINALHVLRVAARTGEVSPEAVTEAINALDNAGIFAPIDDMTGYNVEEYATPAEQYAAENKDRLDVVRARYIEQDRAAKLINDYHN